jgi:hypothetical protein
MLGLDCCGMKLSNEAKLTFDDSRLAATRATLS